MTSRWLVVTAFVATFLAPPPVSAEVPERPPLPESLLTESATDVDAEGDGELEFEANLATVGARAGGASARLTSVEVEWRILKNLGLRLEPSYTRVHTPGDHSDSNVFGVSGALAVGLFHDFKHDFHVQAELLARTPESGNVRVFEPGETELPVAADLLAAIRRGRWTVRATIGAEAGGAFAYAPVHTDLAVLTGVLGEERFGFLALEARADWARKAPLVIAPEFVADATPLGLPFCLGLALPVNIGAEATSPSYGLFMRVIVLTSREANFGRTGGRE